MKRRLKNKSILRQDIYREVKQQDVLRESETFYPQEVNK